MSMFRVFAACLIAALPLAAQPGPRGPVTLAHIHLNAADPDAAIKFWKDLVGAQTYTRDGVNGVIMPGAMILFTKGAPSGPSAGSAIDHVGVKVPNLLPLTTKLEKTSFKVQSNKEGDTILIDGPDGVRVEVGEDNDMYMSLQFDHIHVMTPKVPDSQAWYAAHLGARPGGDEKVTSSRVGNAVVVFTAADSVAPSKGRAIDHLSFDARDLPVFLKTLSGEGVQVEASAPTAFLTDPWGVRIELGQAPPQQ